MPVLIALVLGLAIFGLGLWAVRMLGSPVPPEPDPGDVIPVDVEYRCSVCGLRLTVTHARDGAVPAPRHCREEMEPVG